MARSSGSTAHLSQDGLLSSPFFFFLAAPHGLQDLRSPIRD